MGLITRIHEAKKSLGDLSDLTLTMLLAKKGLSENGFEFSSIENIEVTFAVPTQDLSQWYNERGLAEEKIRLAEEISEKYGLQLYMPPISSSGKKHFQFIGNLSLKHNDTTLARAHPEYLKIAVLSGASKINPDELFNDLCGLYK